MPTLPHCVVFDFDGTLVDSNPLKRDAFFRIFADTLVPASLVEEVLHDLPTADRFGIIEEVLRRAHGTPADPVAVQSLATAYNAICETGASQCPEMPGATETLRQLARLLPLHVNSATQEEPLRRIIERRGWTAFFTSIRGRPTSKLENLRLIARSSNTPPECIVLVGDGREDARAARAFGCAFIAMAGFPRDEWPEAPFLPGLHLLFDCLSKGHRRLQPQSA